jgi:hypothetical protein
MVNTILVDVYFSSKNLVDMSCLGNPQHTHRKVSSSNSLDLYSITHSVALVIAVTTLFFHDDIPYQKMLI